MITIIMIIIIITDTVTKFEMIWRIFQSQN